MADPQATQIPIPRPTVGERLRLLRRSAGLSQAELAGGRFSKEYVSQIERGKTQPTDETLEWLADRLGVERSYLETGPFFGGFRAGRRPGCAS